MHMRLTRVCLYSTTKRTTRIFGLPVHPKPKEALVSLYKTTLTECKELPEDSVYRKSVEAITQKRLGLVESAQELKIVETELNAGQIEEVIVQAEDELGLLRKMKKWKPWEPLEVTPAENQWTYFNILVQKSQSLSIKKVVNGITTEELKQFLLNENWPRHDPAFEHVHGYTIFNVKSIHSVNMFSLDPFLEIDGKRIPIINGRRIVEFNIETKEWKLNKMSDIPKINLNLYEKDLINKIDAFIVEESFKNIRIASKRLRTFGTMKTCEYVDLETEHVLISKPLRRYAEYESVQAIVFPEGYFPYKDPQLVTLNNVITDVNVSGVVGKFYRTSNMCYSYYCDPNGATTKSKFECGIEDVICFEKGDVRGNQGANYSFNYPGEWFDPNKNWTNDGYKDGKVWIKYINVPVIGTNLKRDEDGSFKSAWNKQEFVQRPFVEHASEPNMYYHNQVWSEFMQPKFTQTLCSKSNISTVKCQDLNNSLVDLVKSDGRQTLTVSNLIAINPSLMRVKRQLKSGRGKSSDDPIYIGEEAHDGFYNAYFSEQYTDNSTCEEGGCLTTFGYSKTPIVAYGQAVADYASNHCIVYHELMHYLTSRLLPDLRSYSAASFGSSADPGAMNEGWSDYWAAVLCKTEDFRKSSTATPRRTLKNDYRSCYPYNNDSSDIVGQVHSDSMIFTGALWEFRTFLNNSGHDQNLVKLKQSTFDDIILMSESFASSVESFSGQFEKILGLIAANGVLSQHLPDAKRLFEQRDLNCTFRIMALNSSQLYGRGFFLPSKTLVGMQNFAAGSVQLMFYNPSLFYSRLSSVLVISWQQMVSADMFQYYDRGVNMKAVSYVVSIGCPISFNIVNATQIPFSTCTNETLTIRKSKVYLSKVLGLGVYVNGFIQLRMNKISDQPIFIHLINFEELSFQIQNVRASVSVGFWINFTVIICLFILSSTLYFF